MKIKWLTNDFVKKINTFLNGDGNTKIEFETELFTDSLSEMSIEEKIRNIRSNRMSSVGAISRDIAYQIINKLPELDKNISKNRCFEKDNYFVYNKDANYWKTFYIGNFNAPLNDLNELEWFKTYFMSLTGNMPEITRIFNEVKKFRTNGNSLVKCSTTTLNNSKYMTANYCMTDIDYCKNKKYEQNFGIYNSRNTDNEFDQLQSCSLKAIRGFVRYDSHEKNESIMEFNRLFNSLASSREYRKAFEITLLILSFYIKGSCMSDEAEYRHLLLTDATLISSIQLNQVPTYGTNKYKESVLHDYKNSYYCKEYEVEC